MSTVKVIVLKEYRSLGKVGSVAMVKMGYAKNYLEPLKIVTRATKKALKNLDQQISEANKINQDYNNLSEQIVKVINGKFLLFVRNASDDGRLYGSVSTKNVIDELIKKFPDLDVSKLNIKRGDVQLGSEVKDLGIHNCKIQLHNGIIIDLKVNVCRSESEGLLKEQQFLSILKESKEELKKNPTKARDEQTIENSQAVEPQKEVHDQAEENNIDSSQNEDN